MDSTAEMGPLMDRVYAGAQPGAAFSEPVVHGAYTIVTATEVVAAGGFGMGSGQEAGPGEHSPTAGKNASGSGGGGGGYSSARPVAVITIGPDGVDVKPVVDVTKLAVAGITAWGAMALVLTRMWRAAR